MMPAAGKSRADETAGDGTERLFLWPSEELELSLLNCVAGSAPKRALKREREDDAASVSRDAELALASAALDALRAAAAGDGQVFVAALCVLDKCASAPEAAQAALDRIWGEIDTAVSESAVLALAASGTASGGQAGHILGAAAVGKLLEAALGGDWSREDAPLERESVEQAVCACLHAGVAPEAAGWAVSRALLASNPRSGQTRVARLIDALREHPSRAKLVPVLGSLLRRVMAELAQGSPASSLGAPAIAALARVVPLGSADDTVAVLRDAEGAVLALGSHVSSSEACSKERCVAVAQLARAAWSRWGSDRRPELVSAVEQCMRCVVAAHGVPVARATLRAIERASACA